MDVDAYPPEVLADEEPRYLRRQKPLEIKRRKFGRKGWKTHLRATACVAINLAGLWVAYDFGHFLLTSPELALVHPEQVELAGNRHVPRESVLEFFAPDRDHSVLRIPIEERRRQLEALPWVEQASVHRVLPNTIQVEIVERTPIAFLRAGSDMSLVDIHGVIFEPPLEGKFHFPVLTGISGAMPQEDREKRTQLFAGFTQQLESARAGALEQVSEVDLSDAHDVRATLTGLQQADTPTGSSSAASSGISSPSWEQADAPVLVHFGDSDFQAKYQTLIEKIGQWQAKTGRVESVDLRFSGQAVVNPDMIAVAEEPSQKSETPQRRAAKHSR
jgi:cell division protein FtsQ